MKLGMVLEGGGMRGMYTAGVLDYFMEKDFYPDGIFGVSAGACHGASYASHQKGRSYRINVENEERREEMAAFAAELEKWSISVNQLAKASPHHESTKSACKTVVYERGEGTCQGCAQKNGNICG